MSENKVVNVDFYTRTTLPQRLGDVAKEQNVDLGSDLIMVKTKIGSPPSYEFSSVGASPEEIQNLMRELAEQDGIDLERVVIKAFSEEP